MNFSSTHNMYFMATLCPPELDKKILLFKYWIKEQFGAIVALKSPAHITFIPPFWMEAGMEEKLNQALQVFASDTNELEIQLEGFSHFGKRVLFVGIQEDPSLEKLKTQVENHFVFSFGGLIKKDDRPFHPHITIANRDLKPGDFEKAWQHFSGKTFNEKFRSKTISLLKLIEGKWKVIGEKEWK